MLRPPAARPPRAVWPRRPPCGTPLEGVQKETLSQACFRKGPRPPRPPDPAQWVLCCQGGGVHHQRPRWSAGQSPRATDIPGGGEGVWQSGSRRLACSLSKSQKDWKIVVSWRGVGGEPATGRAQPGQRRRRWPRLSPVWWRPTAARATVSGRFQICGCAARGGGGPGEGPPLARPPPPERPSWG